MRRLLRAARGVLPGLAIGAALGFGCGDGGGAQDMGEDEDSGEPTPPPGFEGLLVAELEVSAAALGDITIEVVDVRPDTRVEIDGGSWLLGGAGPATVEDDTLRLPLGGAMIVGEHELSMFHQAGSMELRSDPVLIQIVASTPGLLSASLGADAVDSGDRLLAHGQGGAAVLGVVDDAADLVRVRAGAWSASGFELELPGLVAGAGIDGSAGLDLSIATVDVDRWLVAAWLADDGLAVKGRIVSISGPGVPQDEPGEVLELWSLDDAEQLAALGPHELARIDAVTLLDRMVVIGVEARRDVEMVGLGDRLLVTRFIAAGGEPAPPVVLRGPGGADLDLPGDARLWTYAGYESALSVRVGLGFAWLLTIASNGLPSLVDAPGERVSVPVAATWMGTGDGAFGSRHVFALDDADGQARVRVLRINRWSEDTQDPSELVDVLELPAMPSGAPSLAVLDGVPTLVLPMGADDDALALRSTGDAAQIEPVSDLRCDALGLAGPGFDGVGDTLPLACLRVGEVRVGALSVD